MADEFSTWENVHSVPKSQQLSSWMTRLYNESVVEEPSSDLHAHLI